MRFGSTRMIRCSMGAMIVCLLGIALAHGQAGQAGAAQKPLMAEDAFKNVQVLRGIPVKEFMETMGFFAASLNMNCISCHIEESGGSWARYADDTPLKQTARRMVLMVNALNKGNFAGARMVTCYTCHRGSQIPKVIPSLAAQYAVPTAEDPDEVQVVPALRQAVTPDQILDKYIQALGGAQQLAKLTSFTAKGTYSGFDTDFMEAPVDILAKAPGMRATIVHLDDGDSNTTYDGREAWFAAPASHSPVPLLPLVGGDLEGAKVDAQLAFPGQIKQELSSWRTGFPDVTIGDRDAQVVEGTTSTGARIKLYFDKQSGLLVRQVRYTDTVIGVTPTHIEYSDYRTVAGVKLPFTWTVTWVDGQSTIKLSAVQPNAAVDAAKFSKPAPPAPK